MDDRVLKGLAALCLAIAIGAVIGSVQATSRASGLFGPCALIVLPGGDVWLGVDRELWRVSRDGALRDARPVETTGLPGAPANLVHGPDGSVVASVRGDATLYVLDAATARVVRRLSLQWPRDLLPHGSRAIQFAIDDEGRVAVSTGGGHAVALFGPAGDFLARTPSGAYEFTNGLWWSAEGLWTTDTNRFMLRLLDGRTLAELRSVAVEPGFDGRYLGPARARAAGGAGPAAGLIRYQNGMVDGGVSLVAADGSSRAVASAGAMQPNDLDWLGDALLVSDRLSSSILRWSADGKALAPFGDGALIARLQGLAGERHELKAQHLRWLVVAVVFLVLGLAAAYGASALARRRQTAPRALDLSKLGTPAIGHWALARLTLRANVWLPLFMLPVVVLGWDPKTMVPGLRSALGQAWISVLVLIAVVAVVGFALQLRRVRQLARQAEFEPMFNQMAMRKLRVHQSLLAGALEPGEQVLETFHLQPGMAWWVLTDRRLIGFKGTLSGLRLADSVPLSRVKAVANRRGEVVPGRSGLVANGVSWLEIALRDGRALTGATASATLSARVAQKVQRLSGALSAQRSTMPASRAVPVGAGRRWRRTLLSLLVPGAGHFLQHRVLEGAVFFAIWLALVLFLSGPMVWTLVEPYVAVQRSVALIAAMAHGALGLLAAADAWRVEGSTPV